MAKPQAPKTSKTPTAAAAAAVAAPAPAPKPPKTPKPTATAASNPNPGEVLETVTVDPRTLVMQDQVRTVTPEEKAAFEAGIRDMAESLKRNGQLQTIRVRRDGAALIVVSGHRRTLAARTIPGFMIRADVVKVSARQATIDQMLENLDRSDLSLLSISTGVLRMWEDFGHRAVDVATALGRPQSWVSKMLLVAKGGPKTAVASKLIAAGKLTDIEMAYTICKIEELAEDQAKTVADNIENETRKTVLARLRALQKGEKPGAAPVQGPATKTGGDGGDGGDGGKGDPEADAAAAEFQAAVDYICSGEPGELLGVLRTRMAEASIKLGKWAKVFDKLEAAVKLMQEAE